VIRRRGAIAAPLAALLLTAAAAPAQDIGEPVFLGPGVRGLYQHSMAVTIEGGVVVEFRGDAVRGVATWSPPPNGLLYVAEFIARGQRRFAPLLLYGHEPVTASHVLRTAPDGSLRRCADTLEDAAGAVLLDPGATQRVEVSPVGGAAAHLPAANVLSTRCPGPLRSDVAAALPTRTLDRATLRRGATTIDLRGEAPFAAGGLSGTARSTVVLRLSRARRQRLDEPQARSIAVTYAIDRIDGTLATRVSGLPQPELCGPLDACGLSGTVTLRPGPPGRGEVTVVASVLERRPWRDLRTALGLARGGRTVGVEVKAAGGWQGGGGTTTAALQRADGGQPCIDTAPLRHGTLEVVHTDDRLDVRYGQAHAFEPDPLRSRCPGPGVAEAANPLRPLAAGSLPLRALVRRRRPIVRLTSGGSIESDGYAGRTRGSLRLVLRRVRIARMTGAAAPP
jgi:hypothetical protein